MKRFQRGLYASLGVLALAAGMTGCNEAKASQEVGVSEQALLSPEDIIKECGLACPGDTVSGVEIKGIAEGNAAITGVTSVDAFFASVVNFQAAATGVSGGIDAQLAAIRADFGIAADVELDAALEAQITANVDGEIKIDAEPAKCSADVHATLEAQARCDATVDPGKAMVECKGSCSAEVSASGEVMCDANAEVKCTFTPPDLKCEGGCQGTCSAKLDAAASCSGTCKGSCSGNCSAYVKNANGDAECSGSCDGMCTGSCETELAAEATCSGECKGQCTATPPDGKCEANASAKCEAKAEANAMVMCDGKCEGEFEPPMAKAECEASAKADAKVNVQCTPPRVAVSYKLKAVVAGSAEATAQLKFKAALETFASVRLPALLAEVKRAGIVVDAGTGLVTSAGGLVKGFGDAALDADLSIKAKFGLGCAVKELPKVEGIITESSKSLKASIQAAGKLTAAVGV